MLTNPRSQENSDSNKYDDLYITTKPIDIKDKISIDIKDVIDFSFCPRLYNLKNSKTRTISVRELYNYAIHRTVYSYLLALQEDKLENTLEFLKYRWGKDWIKYRKKEDVLVAKYSHHHGTYEHFRKVGIDAIFHFDELMSKDRQCPIIIGHRYQIEIIPNVILTGMFEYVRELTLKNEDKVIQIVKFITHTNREENTNIARMYDLETIAASYAFENLFDIDYFQVVTIDIEKKKATINNYSEKEYEFLKRTIKNVIISIQNNIECVSPDKKCFNCELRNMCMKSIC